MGLRNAITFRRLVPPVLDTVGNLSGLPNGADVFENGVGHGNEVQLQSSAFLDLEL